ncbi:MAG: caspase family protein [Nodosilinea sp.]
MRSGAAKLWILLVGVNHYDDESLPSLRFPAPDCQGLGQALTEATQAFPRREICIHHDFAAQPPTLAAVRQSFSRITAAAQPQDTILFYFSGHGLIHPSSNQAVLCFRDTWQDYLAESGLPLPELLRDLGQSPARQQLVWLDACHSGGMTLWGGKDSKPSNLQDPTPQMVAVLRQRAAQGRGFYALLSCDHDQRSWEFPELGHGVFTYYLMRGLRGEAADDQGVVDADNLYKYIYHQTLRYIDKANQQIRLVNLQKRGKGEDRFQSEYPLQTPKRIVEGMGELILGLQPQKTSLQPPRRALIIDGLTSHQSTLALSKVLQRDGQFSIDYWPQPGSAWETVREAIQTCLNASGAAASDDLSTVLLYLRGWIDAGADGEAWLALGDDVRISRSWLRHLLRQGRRSQQIVILDFPGATGLAEWVEDLQGNGERGQCLIAAAALATEPEQFTQTLLETLQAADAQTGLPVAAWISQLQVQLAGTPLALANDEIVPLSWLSGVQGVIEVLPSTVGRAASARTDGVDLGVCPYLGLRPFSEDQAQYFYGRQDLVQELTDSLRRQAVMVVVGASGSGKSSVVQAGLMAQLRRGKQLPGSDQWWIRVLRPGAEPLRTLAQRLVDIGTERERAYQQLQIEGLLHLGPEGFVQWLRSRPEPMVVLVIDQFEELFTLATPHDRQIWLDLLLGALEFAADRFKLVITLRADFVTPCLEYPALADILKASSRYIPPYLSRDHYREVIIQPAEQVGLQVEPGLLELLLQDLTQAPGELPLLEFVLEKLWQHRQAGFLTVESYQSIGGIRGALEQHAQAVYDHLEPEAQACARWIFLSLTQLGEGTADTRRRIPRSELAIAKYPPALVEATLHRLTAANLVVINTEADLALPQSRSTDWGQADDPGERPSPPLGEPTLEVVHEILIRHWSTLQWWLTENRTRLQIQRQVEHLATVWHRHGRQPDDLLRGQRLAEAEALYIKHTDELSQTVQEFIEAALEVRQQVQRQLKRQLRRTQITAVVIAGLGLGALALGGVAYRQKTLAKVEAINALNASSEALLWSNQPLEALTTSQKAGQALQQIGPLSRWLIDGQSWSQTQWRTAGTLQQAVTLPPELNRFNGHTQAVNGVRFSPSGQVLASASDDGTVRLWQRDGLPLATLARPVADPPAAVPVTDVAFKPVRPGEAEASGLSLAVAGADGTIWLWQVQGDSPRLVGTLKGHQDWVTSVAYSPDGEHLASASRDGTIRLWNLKANTHQSFNGHQGWVNQVAFSPDGQTLVSTGEDATAKLWTLAGKPLKTLQGHRDRVTSASFSPDGQTVATTGADGTVRLWATTTGNSLNVLNVSENNSSSHRNQVNDVSFSPDGRRLATAQADGQIQVWQLQDLSRHTLPGHRGEVLAVQFSPDGQQLASASADETIRLWNPAVAEQLSSTGIYSVAMAPAAGGGADQTPLFAVAGWDGNITLWRATAPDQSTTVAKLEGHQTPIEALAFSPDGSLLASAGSDQQILIWRVSDGIQLASLGGNTARITALTFSPNGALLISAGDGPHLKLWSLDPTQTGLRATSIQPQIDHEEGISSLSMSPDGQFLSTGSYDSTVKLWQIKPGSPPALVLLDTLTHHSAAVATVQFSPDGRQLASGSWDNTVQLWQIQGRSAQTTATAAQTLRGHTGGVTSLAFTPDGKGLLSSGADGLLNLWGSAGGELIKALRGHQGPVRSVAISPDGQLWASGEDNGGVMLWDVSLESLLAQGCEHLRAYLSTNATVPAADQRLCD